MTEDEYTEEILKWRRSLNDTVVRSLAQDYRQGLRDESTLDGYEEYCYRRDFKLFKRVSPPDRVWKPTPPAKPVVDKFCARHAVRLPGMKPGRCRTCRELSGLPPITYGASSMPQPPAKVIDQAC